MIRQSRSAYNSPGGIVSKKYRCVIYYRKLNDVTGLKNAPSISQRAKEHIGKICFIYIDSIIILAEDESTHLKNLQNVFETLKTVQLDKCDFFKTGRVYRTYNIGQRDKTKLSKIQPVFSENRYRAKYTRITLEDLVNEEDQENEVIKEYERAHTNSYGPIR